MARLENEFLSQAGTNKAASLYKAAILLWHTAAELGWYALYSYVRTYLVVYSRLYPTPHPTLPGVFGIAPD